MGNIPDINVEDSMEMLRYDMFYRQFVTRRITDLNKIVSINAVPEMPINCVIHTLDNFFGGNVVAPNMDDELLKKRNVKKFAYIVRDIKQGPVVKPDNDKMILVKIGVNQEIAHFRQQHMQDAKLVLDPSDLPMRSNVQCFVNYNPLWKVRIVGLMREIRHIKFILANVVNTIAEMPDRKHIIHIHLPKTYHQQFMLRDFVKAFKVHNRATLRYQQDAFYLFLVELMCKLHTSSNISIFENIKKDLADNIIFAFTNSENNVLFWNLGTLIDLNGDSNAIIRRSINQINMLVAANSGAEVIPMDVHETSDTSIPVELPATVEEPPTMLQPKQVVEKQHEQVVTHETEERPQVMAVNTAPHKTPTSFSVVAKQIRKSVLEQVTENPKFTVADTSSVVKSQQQAPVTVVKPPTRRLPVNKVDLHKSGETFIKDITNGALEAIEKTEGLTEKQKEKLIELSSKFEEVSLNGKSLKDIITKDVDIEIPKTDLSFLEDNLIDKSMVNTTVTKINKGYIDKVLYRDIARALLSFNKKGVFLTDIQTETKIDSLNRMTTYVAKYEDINRKKHTIRFTFPDLDDYGMALVNGSTKMLKRQRIGNPICKTTPSRVTLNSNYNKALIERNPAMARSFLPYLMKIIRKASGTISVEYGTAAKTQDPLPYEYSSTASKIKSILINSAERTIGFPQSETKSLLEKLSNGKSIFTTRTSSEKGKYKTGDSLYSPSLDTSLKVISVKEFDDIKKHPFLKELTDDQLDEIADNEYDVVELKKIPQVKLNVHNFNFAYTNRASLLPSTAKISLEKIESKYGILTGTHPNNCLGFMGFDGSYRIVDNKENVVKETSLLTELMDLTGVSPSPLHEWVTLKIMDIRLPVIFAICYRFGLSKTLEHLNVNYRLVDAHKRIPELKPSEIVIRFKDTRLIINRVPLQHSLLFSGLTDYNLTHLNMADMDDQDSYYDILQSKNLSIRYLRGIDDYFDLFVDPITQEVLELMGEPTTFQGLLVRATQLLTTEDHAQAAAAENHRYRTYERMVGALYERMSKAYSAYRNKSIGSGGKFSINPYEVQQSIINDQLMENVDTINPVHDIKTKLAFSHTGEGGRDAQTFMIEDRKYAQDNMGVMSEAGIDSGDVGVVAYNSMNANMVNLRGLTDTKDSASLEPSDMLSVSALLVPGVTHDDSKRLVFVGIQLSHYVPVEKYDVSRLRTGYEKVIANLSRPPFAVPADEDGIVVDIDEDLKLVKVEYKSGKRYSYSYGEQYSNNGGGGFYITNSVVLNGISKGKKFKKGDILCYDKSFFKKDPFSNRVDARLGVPVNVVLMEGNYTVDDSSAISPELSKAMEFNPTYVRTLNISKDSVVHKYADIGTEVGTNDPILVFDESGIPEQFETADSELMEMLTKLNRTTPKAKHNGKIVRIEAYHKCKLSDMTKSLASFVRAIESPLNKSSAFAKDSDNKHNYPEYGPLDTDKVGYIDLDETNVVIKFFIQGTQSMEAGDKLVYLSSLKSVVANVLPEQIESEDGTLKIDAMYSASGVSNRIILSVFYNGLAGMVLDKAEQDILNIYFNTR